MAFSKKKQMAFDAMFAAYEAFCSHRGVVADPYHFDAPGACPRTIAEMDSHAAWYRDQLSVPNPPATEKQLKYIKKLASTDARVVAALDGKTPNKHQASGLIDRLLVLEESPYQSYCSMWAASECIERYYKDVEAAAALIS